MGLILILSDEMENFKSVKDKKSIPLLLELCYHVNDYRSTVALISNLVNTVPVISASSPEEAANIILKYK